MNKVGYTQNVDCDILGICNVCCATDANTASTVAAISFSLSWRFHYVEATCDSRFLQENQIRLRRNFAMDLCLEVGDVLTLEERDYTVAVSADKDGYQYLYLITVDEPYEIMFVKVIVHDDDVDLEVVHQRSEKEELMALFQQQIRKRIPGVKLLSVLRKFIGSD
jgi:hypothetical protein